MMPVFFMAWLSIGICVVALALTLLIQRTARATLGLPLAYMISLLLVHLPGAYAFAISGGAYAGMQHFGDAIAQGIFLTAIAALCFVVGVAIAVGNSRWADYDFQPTVMNVDARFTAFCLLGGWFLAFGVGPLRSVPTLGAAIYFGSSVWMLAAIAGLARSVQMRNPPGFAIWLTVLLIYPLTVLLTSGFLSYGSAAVIIVGSLAVIRMKSAMRSLLVVVALGYLGISVFVNYFGARNELRATIWSGSGFEQRSDAVSDAFSDFHLFSHNNPDHLRALTIRLNQNEFVGIAADRLNNAQADYLKGESFRDAALAPIPRAIWKNKPGGGGSGNIVRDMTGINLATKTSWGVGNVMEFYINFGLWSLVPGFVLLGFLIAWLDRRAASALRSSDFSRSLLFFLPCVALIQPNGSLVEVAGGAFAALLAAFALRFAWTMMMQPRPDQPIPASNAPQRGAR